MGISQKRANVKFLRISNWQSSYLSPLHRNGSMTVVYLLFGELAAFVLFRFTYFLLHLGHNTSSYANFTDDPEALQLLSFPQYFTAPDIVQIKFLNEAVLPQHPKSIQFTDDIERRLFHKAQSTTGFLYDYEIEDSHNYSQPVDVDQIAFLILGCKKLSYRLESQLHSWLTFTQHFYFITDEPILGMPNVVVIKPNSTTTYAGRSSGYAEAGERHWRSMLWLKERKPKLLEKLKWIVLVDDDTWMNIPKLLEFLSNYNPNHNLALGQVFHELFTKNRTFLQGGSGMVFSQPAFLAITNQLFKRWCRYNLHGDLSLWSCYKVAGTLLVHSDKFHQWSVAYDKLKHYYVVNPQRYVNQISFHYMNNHLISMKMTCDVAHYWEFPEPEDCRNLPLPLNDNFYLKTPQMTSLRYVLFEKWPSSGGVEDQ